LTDPADPASHTHTRTRTPTTAADRAARRVRILARLQEGWNYDKIGEFEGLTRERVRQIVAASLRQREVDPSYEHVLVQSARLDPALRLAAEKVAEGEFRAIVPMLRVLDRLDKYQAAAMAHSATKEGREERDGKFKQKLADLFRRVRAAREAKEAQEAAARNGEASAGQPRDFQGFSPANH
jgi:hypothetical protein